MARASPTNSTGDGVEGEIATPALDRLARDREGPERHYDARGWFAT